MSGDRHCPSCQQPLPVSAPHGLCVKCLAGSLVEVDEPGGIEFADEAIDSTEPRLVGVYEILDLLAQGGMGAIYRARHRQRNRVVALKMVRYGQFAGEVELRRFRLEAETVARLDHPNIVPIYEIGEHEGAPFISMKLLEGGSLA